MSNPDGKILQNAWPTFASGVTGVQTKASNGQFLGYENTATSVALTAGRHAIEIKYAPKTNAATTPTVRFAWSAVTKDAEAAKTAAAANDVSVVFVDDNGTRTGDGESAQTDVARLSQPQEDLITSVAAAAHAANKKVVVVLNVGSAVQMPWAGNVDAILNMWYPGQEGGTATGKVLYGQVNPSGKLTLTFPTKSSETLFAGHTERAGGTQDAGETEKTIKWTEGLNIGYRWYASSENTSAFKPLFAFGHGLSYTTFGYSGLAVKAASNGGLNVTFTVKNTGSVDGAESPQVYLSPSTELPQAVEQPAIKLVQFDHINLKAGESKTVTLNVAPRELSSWSVADQKWIVGTGARTLQVGTASDDLALKTTVNVNSTVAAPSITTQPVASSVSVGGMVTLTAAAAGSPLPTVAWQVSTDGGTSWTAVPGATSTTYTFTAKGSDNGAQYRAVFSNDLGDAVTNAAKVTVSKLATTISAKLVDSRIKTKQHAKVKTVVTAPVGQVVSGQVEVKVTYHGKTYSKVTKSTGGLLTVTLPKLKAHTYKVYVKYLGNSELLSSQAKTLTLTVKK
jgi:beta-glucosidase